MKTKKDESHSEQQAKAQLESIIEMVDNLEKTKTDEKREEAEQVIHEDPLSVQVRTDWHDPGGEQEKPTEFNILLCTGGPACRIIGELNEYQEPESARIEHQDWFTPWTEYRITAEQEEKVLTYCRQFYFAQ